MIPKEKKWRWGDEIKKPKPEPEPEPEPVLKEDNPSFSGVFEMLSNEELKEEERLKNFLERKRKE